MFMLNIPDMSCGHCVGVITKTIKALDPDAIVSFDLAAHTAQLATSQPLPLVLAALADAGYPVVE